MKSKIYTFFNVDKFAKSHFAEYLLKLNETAEVTVLAKDTGALCDLGVHSVHDFKITRGYGALTKDIWAVLVVFFKLKSSRDSVFEFFTFKCMFLSLFLAPLAWKNRFCYYITGMGFSHDSSNIFIYYFHKISLFVILRFLADTVIVENVDDYKICAKYTQKNKVFIVPGAGIETSRFSVKFPTVERDIDVLFLARLLKDKGVLDFSKAVLAPYFKNKNIVMVGGLDSDNPMSVSSDDLSQIENEGIIEYVGATSAPESLMRRSRVYVFPSYREGLPKSVCEAMGCGCLVIGYDAPGTRDVIKHGVNGILVPLGSVEGLQGSIMDALDNFSTYQELREKAEVDANTEFDVNRIAAIHIKILIESC